MSIKYQFQKWQRDNSQERNPKWPVDYEWVVKLTRNQDHTNKNYN